MKKFWRVNKNLIRYILLIFGAWQITICLLNFIAPLIGFPQREQFSYVEPKGRNPIFFWNWANFDGIHYLDISRKGYGIYQQAFFPLYPTLIRFLIPFFGGRHLMAGIFISNLSLLLSLFFLYKIVLLDYGKSVAKLSLLFLMVFPASFFFGMVYTEGLFLMLVLASFYAARKKKFLLAGILGGLASYTRLVGIFLFPALMYELWQDKKKKIGNLFFVCLVPVGLLKYMYFLWLKYSDPLMFLHVQQFFGAQRSSGKIILLYQVFWRYLKMILTTKWDPLYFTVWLEFLTAAGILTILFLAYKKGISHSYLVFSILAFLTPTLTGTFSSLPRYSLVFFPCFIYLGMIKNRIFRNFLLMIFGFLFVVSTLLFFRGYWIG